MDVHAVDTVAAVGYLLGYVGKGTAGQKGRVSYSRAAAEGWQRATIGVYIHEGAIYWYSDQDSERSRIWRLRKLAELIRREAVELHDRLLRGARGCHWVYRGGQWNVGVLTDG
jgi:hypothetical protein